MSTDPAAGAASAAPAPTPPEPVAPPDPTLTIKHADDPNLNGVVEFRIPSLYEQLAIERRMSELANLGAHPNAAFRPFESLTAQGQFFAEAVATLEHVIVRAPVGFYEKTARGPELAIGRVSSVDQGIIVNVYEGYRLFRQRFRTSRRGDPQDAGPQPAGAPVDASGAEAG